MEHEVPAVDIFYDQEQPGRREGQRIRDQNCPEARARFILVKGTSKVARVSGIYRGSPLGASLLPLRVIPKYLQLGGAGHLELRGSAEKNQG